MTSPDLQTTLHLSRVFKASRERVFQAWTEPHMLEAWFRPMGQRITVTDLKLQVGGGFHFDMIGPDGEHSSVTGTYLEIVRPERLVFTWISGSTQGEQTLVTLDFIEREGVTEVSLTHDRLADEAMVLTYRGGWGSCLEFLGELLQTGG